MDIALVADPATFSYDWGLTPDGTDLLGDDGLRTAIMVSLGTDRLASADDVIPDGTGDRRGCWMDQTLDGAPITDRMGSHDWLYARSKATNETRLGLIASAETALAWMTDAGIAASVVVTASIEGIDSIRRSITVNRLGPNGKTTSAQYDFLWTASACG